MLLFISFLFVCSITHASLNKARELYFRCEKDTKAVNELIALISDDLAKKDPVLKGYKGAAITISADSYSNPFEKLNRFSEGKALLEEAIKLKPTDFDLRFLRFCVQSESPSFLNYRSNLAEDKDFILKNWKSLPGRVNNNAYIENTRKYLLDSKQLSASEKTNIK